MAVVQISRIQVRRGRSLSGTGLPQLASGELAWSLDTQELYIGNGSVAEGSPAVGNTKILTERDLTVQGNLLNLIKYIYKSNDPSIQTGPSPNDPVSRETQTRLDDYTTGADFGTIADGTTDDTASLQRAINQLFLNQTTAAYEDTADGASARVVLDLGPGIYNITGTIYVPSYTTVIGAGPEKTIIKFTGTGPVFRFVNDTSTIGYPSIIGSTLAGTQPRHITMSGMTIWSNTAAQPGLQLDAVRDSLFENLLIKGSWAGTATTGNNGINLNAVSALVTCSNNVFSKVSVQGFTTAVYSKQDILNNQFEDCYVFDCRQGFVLGEGSNGTTVGEQYGPRETTIVDCKFERVKRHAVYIGVGTGNVVKGSKTYDVGNDGGGNANPIYPVFYIGSDENTIENTYSDRSESLANPTGGLTRLTLTLSANVTALKGTLVQQPQNIVSATYVSGGYNSTTMILDNVVGVLYPEMSVTGTGFNGTQKIVTITAPTLPSTQYTIQLSSVASVQPSGTLHFGSATGYVINSVTNGNVIELNTLSITEFNTTDTLIINGDTTPSVINTTVVPTTVSTRTTVPYVPEVAGVAEYNSFGTRKYAISQISSPGILLFRLPVNTDALGVPTGAVFYKVNYVYRSTTNSFTRRGTMNIVVDVTSSLSALSSQVQFTDEFDVTGISQDDALKLEFTATILDKGGLVYTGALNQVPYSVAVNYTNALSGDSGTISYSYSAII